MLNPLKPPGILKFEIRRNFEETVYCREFENGSDEKSKI